MSQTVLSPNLRGQHTLHCLINLGFLYKTYSAYCFFQFAKRLIPQTDVHARPPGASAPDTTLSPVMLSADRWQHHQTSRYRQKPISLRMTSFNSQRFAWTVNAVNLIIGDHDALGSCLDCSRCRRKNEFPEVRVLHSCRARIGAPPVSFAPGFKMALLQPQVRFPAYRLTAASAIPAQTRYGSSL